MGDNAHSAWFFGHQHAPVGQEGESPGGSQPAGNEGDLKRGISFHAGGPRLAPKRGLLANGDWGLGFHRWQRGGRVGGYSRLGGGLGQAWASPKQTTQEH